MLRVEFYREFRKMKKIISYIMTMILIMSCMAPPVSAGSYGSFKDAGGHWAEAYLKRAVEGNVLNGSGGKLLPNGKLSGAQMTAIVTRDCSLNIWTKAYPGIASKEWYYNAAAAAYTAGLLPSDGSLSMTGNVTRAQVFEVLAEAYLGLDPYADYTAEESAAEAGATEKSPEAAGIDTSASSAQSDVKESTSDGGASDSQADADTENKADTDEKEKDSSQQENQEKNQDNEQQAQNTESVLSGFSDAAALSGRQRAAAELLISEGIVKGDSNGLLQPSKSITRAEFVTMLYRIKDSGRAQIIKYDDSCSDLAGAAINITGSDVKAGGTLKAEAVLSGLPSGYSYNAQWYLDGKPVSGYFTRDKVYENGTQSQLIWTPSYTYNMQTYKRAGFELVYSRDGRTVHIYGEKTINIENYPKSHYLTPADGGVAVTQVFDSVRASYTGNYKSSYNPDYLDATKLSFVNGKGYASKTKYLIWANLATQKVNVFEGSKGSWKLVKVFRCASGAKSTPTPQGVTYVTYKEKGWYTDSYVCKPIVRFYPGTGYAFHSVLYTADGSKIKDGSMGFPVSHGCLRMKPSSIQWIYDNIPVNTTVVIY